jgi:hypothetical protein
MTDVSECNRLVGWVQFARFCLPLIALTWLLTACVAPQKYTPTIGLTTPEQSEPSISLPIPVTVRMVKLFDVSPAKDKEDGWLYGSGWSVTSAERLKGELAVLITDAVARDFQSHGVFQALAQDQQQQQEQMRLGGKIHKFSQRREQYLWALCCGLLGAILPFPLMKEEGEVDLELTLFRTDDSAIKSYRGKSSFLKRCNFYESRCWESYNNSPAKYLDQAFADSLHQIRQAIRQDKDLIAQQVSKKMSKLP